MSLYTRSKQAVTIDTPLSEVLDAIERELDEGDWLIREIRALRLDAERAEQLAISMREAAE